MDNGQEEKKSGEIKQLVLLLASNMSESYNTFNIKKNLLWRTLVDIG